jgi:hypothetical protein
MIDARILRLCEVADLRAGYPFRGAIDPIPGGSVGVVQMSDIDPARGVDWSGVLRTELSGRKPPEWLAQDELLFVPRGNRFYAVCLDAPPLRSVCSPHLFHLRVRPSVRLLPAFLAWQLNQSPLQRHLHAAAEGSSQVSIRRADLEALPISVPSLEDQQRVVSMALAAGRERSLLHALIRNREQQFEAMALSLLEAGSRAP